MVASSERSTHRESPRLDTTKWDGCSEYARISRFNGGGSFSSVRLRYRTRLLLRRRWRLITRWDSTEFLMVTAGRKRPAIGRRFYTRFRSSADHFRLFLEKQAEEAGLDAVWLCSLLNR